MRVTALCPGPVPTEFGAVAQRAGNVDAMPAPDIFKIPAGQVVRDALNAVEDDRPRVIPGWLIALVMTLTALTPLFILRMAMNRQGKQ